MDGNINENEEVVVEVICGDGSKFLVGNNLLLLENVCSQIMVNNCEYEEKQIVVIRISDQSFISSDAKKIFRNMFLNSYDLISGLVVNKEKLGNIDQFSYQIMTDEMTEEDLGRIINMFLLMVEKANMINRIILHNVKNPVHDQSLLMRYKGLIEGLKSTYEKGLILVKLLFNEQRDSSLLSKYYRLIQGKDKLDKRKELLNDLLFEDCQKEEISDNFKYVRKKLKIGVKRG